MAFLKPCRNSGCPHSRPCPDHPDNQEYDRYRGSAASRGYDHAWSKLSKRKLRNDPLCQICSTDLHPVIAVIAHHVKPVDQYPELRLKYDNLLSVCHGCHDDIDHDHGNIPGVIETR